MDLGDLRLFLALARESAVRPAAKRLGISHSTVTRRIQAFEARLGTRVFDRTPDGFVLTAAGKRVFDFAQDIEERVAGLERDLSGQDGKLEGTIRITIPNTITRTPVIIDIARFAAEYPDIELQLIESYDFADLSRREADIAIRYSPLGRAPPGHLVGRRLAIAHHAVYVARDGLRDPKRPCLLGRAESGNYLNSLLNLPVADVQIRHLVVDPIGQAEACAAGMGYALLACLRGDSDARLRRLDAHKTWASYELWLLTHPDIRYTARYRLFREFITEAIGARRDLIEGRSMEP